MNKKIILKLTLDIVMTLLMIVLMGYNITGNLIHEILGIAVLVMIIIHNLLNIKWFISVFKGKQKNYKLKLKVIINLLLTINSIFLLISSLIISQNVFLFLGIANLGNWTYIHRLTAYLEIIMIAIHLGFHWKMVIGAFRKMFKLKDKNKLRTFLLRLIALTLAVVGVKASFDRDIATNLLPGNTVTNSSDVPSVQSTSNETVSSTDEGYTYNGVSVSDGDTLNDFLGNIVCTACGRHCSLLRPQCSRGENQASEATAVYEDYTNAETATESATTETIASYESSNTNTTENTICIELDSKTDDSLFNLFTDYIPIMGLYVAGVYYTLEIIDKLKSKK